MPGTFQEAVARPRPIAPELASDGIDGKGEWVVNLGPESAVSAEYVHRKGDVALHGPHRGSICGASTGSR